MVFLKAWALASMLAVGQQGGAGTTRVAVVNIGAVSEQYEKTRDLEATFEQKRVAFNQKRDEIRQRIETTKRSLQEEFKPGTPEFEERRRQLALAEFDLQAFTDTEGQKIEAGLAVSLRDIYADIAGVVGEVAAAQGLDLVLAVDQLPAEAPATTAQARQQIVLQKVLYWTPRVDLTAEVVARVNAKYQATKPPAGATAPPFAEDGLGHRPATNPPSAPQP